MAPWGPSLTKKPHTGMGDACLSAFPAHATRPRRRWAEGKIFFALPSRTLLGAGCLEGSAWGSLEKGRRRLGIGFLTVLMVGLGLGSQQVSALFACLELHEYHLPCPARCRAPRHYFGHKEGAAK